MSRAASVSAHRYQGKALARRRARALARVCGAGLLAAGLSSAWADPYVFHEDFSAPPLTAGTAANDWTDGWNNGDHGWEVSEGTGNVADSYYFSQRSDGPYFTGGKANIGVLRTDGTADTAAAIQNLPTDQNYISGNVKFSFQNTLGYLGWGAYTKLFLVGQTPDENPAYATQIYFGNETGTDDRLYVQQYSGAEVVVADANTLTTDGKPLAWNGDHLNPNLGSFATMSVDFDVNTISVTLSTTDAAGNTSSTTPVSFPTDNGVVKFTRVGFFIQQAHPANNGLVWMSDFLLTANGEAPVVNAAWNVDGDGNWSEASNWQGGVPNAAGATANFGTIITSGHTVTVDAPQTVGVVNFSSPDPNVYTVAGSSTLTLDGGSGSTSINVTAGSPVISAPIVLAKDTTIAVSGGGNLSVAHLRGAGLSIASGAVKVLANGSANSAAGTSKLTSLAIAAGASLDLTNNSMVVDYSGPVGTLISDMRGMLQSGQLTSSSADATKSLGYADNAALGLSSFAGQTVDADSVLVKYTYLGDTNLDGQVDVIDLGNLATAWQTSGTWAGGDSNYDGFVDVIDLGLLATNWQAGVGSPLGPGSLDQALAAYGLPGVSVPEPAGLALIGLCLAGVVSTRRR